MTVWPFAKTVATLNTTLRIMPDSENTGKEGIGKHYFTRSCNLSQ